jgi:hypothetical protein
MAGQREDSSKERRGIKAFHAVKDAVRTDMRLFHISSWTTTVTREDIQTEIAAAKAEKEEKVRQKHIKNSKKRMLKPEPPAGRLLIVEGSGADQSACKLLQLPSEIRRKIWIEAFGRNLFFGGTLVRYRSPFACKSSNDFIHHSVEWKRKSMDVINLLLICRKMQVYD